MIGDLTEIAKIIHAGNYRWWHDEHGNRLERPAGQLLMLVTSELAEAMEGVRKGLPDDHLPHRSMEEVEIADFFIRMMDFAGEFKLTPRADLCFDFSDNSDKASQLFEIVQFVAGIKHSKGSEIDQPCFNAALTLAVRYCEIHGLDLEGAITEKLVYNKSRVDHTHEARAKANGKKF